LLGHEPAPARGARRAGRDRGRPPGPSLGRSGPGRPHAVGPHPGGDAPRPGGRADVTPRDREPLPLRHRRSEAIVLRRLLRDQLRPYRKVLLGMVGLQAVQTTAALTLPTLNARIIDRGIVRGDLPYIWRMGGVMLVFAL